MGGRPGAPVIRFGVFEVDLHACELRKRGIRISIQAQPFRLLAILLERPGQLVTRDEVQARLWGDDTFVDFDRGVNLAQTAESLGCAGFRVEDPARIQETLTKARATGRPAVVEIVSDPDIRSKIGWVPPAISGE